MNKEIQKQLDEAEKLKYLSEKYLDLEIKTNRWRNNFFVSKSSAEICNKFYLKRNCGCCDDSPISLSLYFEDEKTKEQIYYMSPDEWFIGEGSCHAIKDLDISDVEEKLIKDKINYYLVTKILSYLRENKHEYKEEYDAWNNDF